ncbi:MAG: peptidoglycan recognition family protein [Phycisphaerales bacterium]
MVSERAKVVWLALVGAMTGLGGVLLAVDGGRTPRSDGLAMPPLVAAQPQAPQIESVFRTRQALDNQRWTSIVIHQSGEHFGSWETIEKQHLKQRLKGLGHHFVVGNGSGMDDGAIYVGFRWLDQLPGAHATGPRAREFNEHGISICLVGNIDRSRPTSAQMASLTELVASLCRQLSIPPERVLLASDIAPVSDPGRRFPEAQMRQRLADMLR